MTNAARYLYKGEHLTIREISDRTGVPISTLRGRLDRGLTIEQAVVRVKEKESPCKTCEFIDSCNECVEFNHYRKAWGFFTESEVRKLRNKNCHGCKYVWKEGSSIMGCSYADIVGCCRGCDPRDCREFGFYKKGKRIKRKLSIGSVTIVEGEL